MNLIREWWIDNKNVWFGSTESDDIEITSKFENMFDLFFDENFLMENLEHGCGYIILHDQIARHVKRSRNYSEQFILDKLEKILGFVKKFYSHNIENLSGYDFCFVLIPLRHTNKFDSQLFVINETWKKIIKFNPDTTNIYERELIKIYKNYLKASYERATKGIISENLSNDTLNIHDEIEEFIKNFSDIFDTSCHHYKLNICSKSINNYDSNNKIVKECIRLKNNFPPNIILSISGGIDSMILSWILTCLGINFVMVHINYANRGEVCKREKNMLAIWAKYLKIKLYVRDIEEINRPICMEWDLRNLYESYTRDVRFQSYIDVAKINGWCDGYWGIMLGHNHDDCVENIFTNIVNKTKYENLYGMEFISSIRFKSNQLCFIRPILTITKEEIYNFAHNSNIPYLFDSTPKWSQRGQIRDLIRPALINWNKSSIDGFDELTKVTSNCIECVDMLVGILYNKLIWFDELENCEKISTQFIGLKICLHINPHTKFKVIKIKINELMPNKIFWLRFLDKIYSSNTNSKCIDELILKIHLIKKKFNKLQIKQVSQIQLGYLYSHDNSINKQKNIYYWKVNEDEIILGFDII